MISDVTRQQLSGLSVSRHRPLVICDVDEVVVHFTRDFERYLDARGLWLDAASLALNGNVRWTASGHPAEPHLVAELVDGFFADRTRHMEPIEGAVESLLAIAASAEVVMLSNLPHSAGEDRRANLADLGLAFPLITNSGPKGPAIRHLTEAMERPVVFIDDSPNFISSAYEHAPDVHLIHFMHDERFARHVPHVDYVSLRTGTWHEAKPHILEIVGRE